MATKMDHVKTDILPDGSQSEPDYRHLMSSSDQEPSVVWIVAVSITILAIYLSGFACGCYYGYEQGQRDQLVEVIGRGIK